MRHQTRRGQRNRKRFLLMLAQIILAAFVLVPFAWMFSVSLKPAGEPFAIPARLWPLHPTLANYANAFQPQFRRYLLNSTILSVSTMIIAITVGLLAAYSFSRFRIRGFGVLLLGIIAAQLFPVATLIIPLYKIMRGLHLLNTYAGLIAAYLTITLPVATWMLLGFIRHIPRELEEAALTEGATRLEAFLRVIVPLARPGIAATAVWIVVVTWQEFIFALAFTSTKDMRTVSIGMNDFIGQYGIRYGEMMASAIVISIPIMVVFFFLQRQFVAGLTAGATKG